MTPDESVQQRAMDFLRSLRPDQLARALGIPRDMAAQIKRQAESAPALVEALTAVKAQFDYITTETKRLWLTSDQAVYDRVCSALADYYPDCALRRANAPKH